MPMKYPYSYVVLRYVHDAVAGEFVNVGIALAVPDQSPFIAKTRKTIGRIKDLFPDLEKTSFTGAMKAIDRGIRSVNNRLEKGDLFSPQKDASGFARLILPDDDSSLQWSPVGSGLTSDSKVTLDRLFARYVSKYDNISVKRKSDEDIWRPVKDALATRGVELQLESKTITGNKDSIDFTKAWKNGCWHAYETLSFDLADADGIKDKARRWRGHLEAVTDGVSEELKLHFLLGKPENPSLLDAFESAARILEDAPFDSVVFKDDSLDEFVDDIEDEFRKHTQQTSLQVLKTSQ